MSNGPIVISDKLDSWCVGLGPIIVICGPANQKTILRGTGALLTAFSDGWMRITRRLSHGRRREDENTARSMDGGEMGRKDKMKKEK